jgi:hypothetical protein
MESRRTRTGRVLQRRKSRFLSNGRNEGKEECSNPSFLSLSLQHIPVIYVIRARHAVGRRGDRRRAIQGVLRRFFHFFENFGPQIPEK